MTTGKRYGVAAGILIALWNAFEYFYAYHTWLAKLTFFINIFLLLYFLLQGMKVAKKEKFKGQITFANAGLSGIILTILAAVTLSGITFVYRSYRNPEYEKYVLSQTVKVLKEHQKTREIPETVKNLKQSFDPVKQAQSSFFITLIFGIVFSFVFAMVLRNKAVTVVE